MPRMHPRRASCVRVAMKTRLALASLVIALLAAPSVSAAPFVLTAGAPHGTLAASSIDLINQYTDRVE